MGTYTLVARGLDDAFSEEHLAFEVTGTAAPVQAAASSKESPPPSGPPHVDFFPEGGHLAAGIENRVYFSARDAQGQPLEIRGTIVSSKSASVARVETAGGGRGVFSITPDPAETYRLSITSPAGVSQAPVVPPASADEKVAISTGQGVFAPGAPLEFIVRAAKDNLPLVVTARLRGMLVGQQLLVTSSDRKANASRCRCPWTTRSRA